MLRKLLFYYKVLNTVNVRHKNVVDCNYYLPVYSDVHVCTSMQIECGLTCDYT